METIKVRLEIENKEEIEKWVKELTRQLEKASSLADELAKKNRSVDMNMCFKRFCEKGGVKGMTKIERELEHDRETLKMMANVSRHADVQALLNEEPDTPSWIYYIVAFATGCLAVLAIQMLMTWL